MHWRIIPILGLLTAIGGCTGPAKPDLSTRPQVSVDPSTVERWQETDLEAETRDEILERVRYYQSITGDDAVVRRARVRESSLLLLLGAAYAESRSEQKDFYRQAAQSAEQAMLLDDAFHEARLAGQSVPAAASGLEPEFFEPLFLWATAVFYHFRDVASVPERILFNGRLGEAAEAIEVMVRKEPDWYGGSLQFSLGIYYLSVPEIIGGDREKAGLLMEEAVGMSDKRLLPVWGRAKYLAVALGDKEGFRKDLQWVLRQDLSEMEGPPVWNRYFQEDARRLLENEDLLFP